MSPPGRPAAPAEALELPPPEADPGARVLLASAAAILVGGGLLLWFLVTNLEDRLTAQLLRTDLERKASLYTQQARRLLEGSELSGYVERGPGALLRFEELLSQPDPGEQAAFVHVREGDSETLLFKGQGVLQKITVSPARVEVMEGEGATVRRIVVQEGEEPLRLLDVETPLTEAVGEDLVKKAFRTPEDRLQDQIAANRAHLRRRLVGAGVAGISLVALVFYALGSQFRRVRALEAQVRRQRQLAYLGTLAGGLAHEIRNPLNGIGLNLHLLEESVRGADPRVEAQAGRYLGRIQPALKHLETIVEEFLDFARPRPMQLKDVRLDRLLADLVEFLKPEAAERGIPLELAVAPEVKALVVEGDLERLRQVFLNLIRNAWDAHGEAPAGGLVRVELARAGRGRALVRVRDRGPGVPAERRERVFQIFFTSRDQGLGLGLPLVRRIVEDHGGRVEVEAAPPPPLGGDPLGGACFLVELPLR